MKIEICIRNIQSISEIQFALNLEQRSLICVTGKNGAGKTTLIKAIRNLVNADTFPKTTLSDSITEASSVDYLIDERRISFSYNPRTRLLDSRDPIPSALRRELSVELAIPYGERFNFFQKISGVDDDLRTKIVSQEYSKPEELIEFLQDVYPSKRFEDLVQVNHRGVRYYCRLLPGGRYAREDYLSSGEYFLIGLYRRISVGCRAIIVDEVDISLDAAAQVKLIGWLRRFRDKYKTVFLITTHSLAMMRKLDSDELFYLEQCEDGVTRAKNVSYNYIKSILYGFHGWDRYILTEDEVLQDFLAYVLKKHCSDVFYRHKVIYIGGGSNTVNLLLRNAQEKLFSEPENVIAILDGDQRKLKHAQHPNVYCIPMESVEKELLAECLKGRIISPKVLLQHVRDADRLRAYLLARSHLPGPSPISKFFSTIVSAIYSLLEDIGWKSKNVSKPLLKEGVVREREFSEVGKKLYKALVGSGAKSRDQIFAHMCSNHDEQVRELGARLQEFLSSARRTK